MKKIFFSLIILLLSIQNSNAEVITVPKGTVVPIELQQNINSRKLKADDLVQVTVARDVLIDDKVIFAKGADGYLRVFDCIKVDTWGSNWRAGATIDFDGAELRDVTGQLRKFNYNEHFKGEDIIVGTSVGFVSNTSTTGNINGQVYNSTGNMYGSARYSQNSNTMSSAFANGHRFIGENIMIKKGKRFRIDLSESFNIDVK